MQALFSINLVEVDIDFTACNGMKFQRMHTIIN